MLRTCSTCQSAAIAWSYKHQDYRCLTCGTPEGPRIAGEPDSIRHAMARLLSTAPKKTMVAAIVAVLACVSAADACSIIVKKGEAPVVKDCVQTSPQQGAAVLAPNQTFQPTHYAGPRVFVTGHGAERWQIDFLRSVEIDSHMKYLRNLGDYIPGGIPLVPVFYPTPTFRH